MNKSRVELERDEDGRWSAWIEELPGCAAWGYSREEALVGLKDAAIAYIEDMIEAAGARSRMREERSTRIERKLRAIQEAAKHEFPTADIEAMLREIYEGRA